MSSRASANRAIPQFFARLTSGSLKIHAYFQETDHVPIEAPLLRGNVEVDLSQLGRKSRGTRRLAPDTFPIAKSAGYDPCNCTGEACPIDAETSNCQCWARETWCDRFCSCASNCEPQLALAAAFRAAANAVLDRRSSSVPRLPMLLGQARVHSRGLPLRPRVPRMRPSCMHLPRHA